MAGEVAWEEEGTVGQEGPVLPACASTWRLRYVGPPQVATTKSRTGTAEKPSSTTDRRAESRVPSKGKLLLPVSAKTLSDRSVTLQHEVRADFQSSTQKTLSETQKTLSDKSLPQRDLSLTDIHSAARNDFHSAAKNLLESLVSEHERILAERLQMAAKREVSLPESTPQSDAKREHTLRQESSPASDAIKKEPLNFSLTHSEAESHRESHRESLRESLRDSVRDSVRDSQRESHFSDDESRRSSARELPGGASPASGRTDMRRMIGTHPKKKPLMMRLSMNSWSSSEPPETTKTTNAKKEILPSVGESSMTQSEDRDSHHSDASHASGAFRGSVQRVMGSHPKKQRSLMRFSVNSLASDHEDAFNSVDVMINSASNRFVSMRIQNSLRIQSDVIEAIMGVAIVLDLLSLGLGTTFSRSWTGWLLADTVLAGIFSAELLREMCTSSCRNFFAGEAWRKNVSEVLLVALTWIEISTASDEPSDYQSLLLFVRLLRVIRVFRVRVFSELFMMANGVLGSYRTLLSCLVLISLPLYCIALVLTETLGQDAHLGKGAEKFAQLDEALFTVFRCFVASDCTQEDGKPLFMLLTTHHGWHYGVLYCVVQFGMTFGLYNVITAIYVEKVLCAAKFNELAVKRMRFQDRQYFEKKAKGMLEVIWQLYFAHEDPIKGGTVDFDLKAAGRLQLTRGFFDELCKEPSFINILRSLDISEDDQMDLFETLDIEGRGTIDPMSLVIGVGKLRGEARKADIVSIVLQLRSMQSRLLQIDEHLLRMRSQSASLRTELRLSQTSTSPPLPLP